MQRDRRHFFLLLLPLLLAGCQSLPPPAPERPAGAPPRSNEPFRNIYTQERDSAPTQAREVDYHAIPDAVPRVEPLGRYGNKSPYEVLGRTYEVDFAGAHNYRAEGIASWYGEKFHGFMTSSMEPYDMYAMTAAHTRLPIPSYVRVTNLENGRSVVVRVNDRGPFHEGRIIDLSWAAAQKLGYAQRGTARVRVEALATPAPPAAPGGFYVQLGAFAFPDAANRLGEQVRGTLGENPQVLAGDDTLHRVRLGPYADRAAAERMRERLREAGLGNPVLVAAP